MKFDDLKIDPFTISLDPALHVAVKLHTEYPFPLPIRFTGYIFIGVHRIAVLDYYDFNNSSLPDLFAANFETGGNKQQTNQHVFTANLSPKALEKMENSRDKKGDLYLDFRIKGVLLKPSFNYHQINDNGHTRQMIEAKNNALFHTADLNFSEKYRITSSDWIHDFVPAFNNQKYMVFEVPQPEMLNADSVVKQKMKEAINTLPNMEDARSKGEWNLVIKESRPIWELLNNREELFDTLKGDLNPDAVGVLKNLIGNFWDLGSKFQHKLDKKKELMDANNASKADAELVYAMAFSIVNFICNKLK